MFTQLFNAFTYSRLPDKEEEMTEKTPKKSPIDIEYEKTVNFLNRHGLDRIMNAGIQNNKVIFRVFHNPSKEMEVGKFGYGRTIGFYETVTEAYMAYLKRMRCIYGEIENLHLINKSERDLELDDEYQERRVLELWEIEFGKSVVEDTCNNPTATRPKRD